MTFAHPPTGVGGPSATVLCTTKPFGPTCGASETQAVSPLVSAVTYTPGIFGSLRTWRRGTFTLYGLQAACATGSPPRENSAAAREQQHQVKRHVPPHSLLPSVDFGSTSLWRIAFTHMVLLSASLSRIRVTTRFLPRFIEETLDCSDIVYRNPRPLISTRRFPTGTLDDKLLSYDSVPCLTGRLLGQRQLPPILCRSPGHSTTICSLSQLAPRLTGRLLGQRHPPPIICRSPGQVCGTSLYTSLCDCTHRVPCISMLPGH